jgi:hypothetical protein
MAIYRLSRTLPNGWRIRLDLVPYDENLNGTVTPLGDVCLLELGSQTAEFETLPYGLVKPQTLKFKLAWSMLPSAVQDYIEDSVDPAAPNKCNLWVLYSDRGTSGATYTVEYAGVEDNVEAVQLEPLDDGSYGYNVELVDYVFHAMKTLTGNQVFNGKIGAHRPPETEVFQFLLRNLVGRNQKHLSPGRVLADTFATIMGYIRTAMGTHIKTNYARTTLGFSGSLFDFNTLDKLIEAAIELYTMGLDNEPRTISTAVTSQTSYLTTNISKDSYGGATIGGLYSLGDNFAWGRRDVTVYDIIRDLCETLGVKASYNFEAKTQSGNIYLDTNWYVKRIASSLGYANNVDTTDATLSLNQSLALPTIIKRGDNIAKAESRYETSHQEDATEIVRLKKGARSSRSMNIEPIIHNVPVYMTDYDKIVGRTEVYKQTNQILFKANNGSLVKVHETTKFWYGPKSTQWVKISSTASNNPQYQDDDSQEKYRVQLAAMQAQTSMPAALCLLHLHVFADENNATCETEWNYTKSTALLPSALCGRHTLTDSVVDIFDSINWEYALPTSISVDWFASTSKINYYVLAPTTSQERT